MMKRTKFYSVVRGVTVEDGEVHECEYMVDGRTKSADNAMRRARKQHPNFLPTSAEYHAQTVTMSDADFFEHGTFGEDTVVEYSGSDDNIVADDIIEE